MTSRSLAPEGMHVLSADVLGIENLLCFSCTCNLHVKCDIAKTYLFWYSCISQVPNHDYSRIIILGRCHKSCSLLMCEQCGMGTQRTQLTLSGCHVTSPMPSYHHQWFQPDLPGHTPWPLPHAYCTDPKQQYTQYCCMIYDMMCWTCRFHGMDMVSSNFDDRAPWE